MDNKKKNAATAMTAILAASIVVNPMAVPVYAQEIDTTVIEQQTEQEESVQTPNEESDSQKTEDVPAVTKPEEDIPATDTEEQTDIPETPNMMFHSAPAPMAAGDVEINEANFPDEAFRTWLEGQKYGEDNVITADEIAGITSINIQNNKNIKSLKGIEHFTELTSLECSYTGITSLDMSKNKALKNLYCFQTELADLNVSENQALETLDCHSTKLINLDVSKNTALKTLYCASIAGITSLDVSKNTNLTSLSCKGTSITSLDVSQNTKLEILYCSNTGITELNLSQNIALRELDCHNLTEMTTLDVSKNTALTYLECASIGITELDVSHNTELTFLNCYDTRITTLDLSHNTALKTLYCYDTGLTSLDLSKNTVLKHLECYGTGITSLDLSHTTVLDTLRCKDCPLVWLNIGNNTNLKDDRLRIPNSTISLKVTEDTFKITDISNDIDKSKVKIIRGAVYDAATGMFSEYHEDTPIVYEYDCGTAYSGPVTLQVIVNLTDYKEPVEINEANFPDQAFRTWLKEQKYGKDEKLTADEIAGITSMSIADKEDIKDLTGIEHFTALTILDCSGTGITSLDVSSNKVLKTLNCAFTGIESLDVSQNQDLTYLNCNYTGITELDVSQNTALESLYCSNAKMTSLEVGQNKALTRLDCRYNTGITSLDVSQSTALTHLYCSSTGITELDVSQNTALKDLRCGDTKIKKLDVSRNTNLTFLDCSANSEIKELDVSYNTALTSLACGVTGIESLDVSNNTHLTSLDCGSTKITKLDVSKNPDLKDLDCGSTKIKSLNVSQNPDLKSLYCAYTEITSLDVSQNTALTSLECQYCPLAWLNIGNNTNLAKLNKAESVISLAMTEDTFQITDKIAGIDRSKVTITKGADYDSSAGTVSNYRKGVPIEYTYDCGTSAAGTQQRLSVKLKLEGLKDKSSISITGNLNKTYDGTAVSDTPEVTKTGSTGAVTYKWEKEKSDGEWSVIDTIPTDAGTYRVTAYLASDADYKESSSDPVVFTIEQADSTIGILEILDKTYDGTAVNDEPEFTSTGSTGAVTYKWEKKESDSDWKEIPSAPVDAGRYRVTVTIASSDNYKGASSKPVEFTIGKAAVPQVVEPDNLSAVQDDMLSSIDLPNGWTWVDKDTMVTAANSGYKARLTVDDSNYDYTGTDGYSQSGHYVERTLTVTVSQGQNVWVTEPSISNWTYGEAASTPQGSAEHGTVNFTYSSSETGTFSADVPTTAGTWYMKASVPASSEYTGLNKIIAFTIEPKNTEADSQITVPDITDVTDLGNLTLKDGDKELVQGTDYEVTREQDGDKVTVTITFKGNYSGTITKTYTVDTDKPGSDKTDTDKPSGDKTDTGNKGDTGNKKNTDKKGNTGGAVQTGDTVGAGLWTTLLALSAGLTAFLVGKKRKTTAEDSEEI